VTPPKPPRQPPSGSGTDPDRDRDGIAILRAKLAAEIKRRDAFARQAAKIKKVAARISGSGRARGR
jgi:hypothetical protein